MGFSLIVPIAADRQEFERKMPYVFLLGEDGISLCLKSILGLNLSAFDRIYLVMLRKHDQLYSLRKLLSLQLERLKLPNIVFVLLDEPTRCQAETIYQTVKLHAIQGPIFIKDPDGYFECDIFPENGIAIYPLEKMQLVNPQNKSYVAVDDMFYITNIIEKRIVSNYFNAGGYCFERADEYCSCYEALTGFHQIFLSHIVFSMLLSKTIFRPFPVSNFEDWGTDELYTYYIQRVRGDNGRGRQLGT